jgi:hypothetical protein
MTNDKHTIKEQDQEQRKTNSRNKQHKIKEQKTQTHQEQRKIRRRSKIKQHINNKEQYQGQIEIQ